MNLTDIYNNVLAVMSRFERHEIVINLTSLKAIKDFNRCCVDRNIHWRSSDLKENDEGFTEGLERYGSNLVVINDRDGLAYCDIKYIKTNKEYIGVEIVKL